ncbi:MAG: signal peptidase II [Kiritimatiellae bacterium]|jgi:signal peptidase II|nr:signal peptidase II [Kiritimatiellia bacterium]
MLLNLLILFVVFSDQLVKFIINKNLALHQEIVVIPGFFNINYVRNTGAAWGIFSSLTWLLGLLSALAFIAIIIFRHKIFENNIWHKVAYVLLAAGIAGNMIDRIKNGYVIDFLHFYFQNYHYPSFNIADSAICIGVVCYMIPHFLSRYQKKEKAIED